MTCFVLQRSKKNGGEKSRCGHRHPGMFWFSKEEGKKIFKKEKKTGVGIGIRTSQ
jgi:hypothetical protein